jgi:hypothetical protein
MQGLVRLPSVPFLVQEGVKFRVPDCLLLQVQDRLLLRGLDLVLVLVLALDAATSAGLSFSRRVGRASPSTAQSS